MQFKIYILFFSLKIYGFQYCIAHIGHNVRPVDENEFPGVACITTYHPNRTWSQKLLCTGTLIAYNYILTAAHCFDQAMQIQIEISMGAHELDAGQRYYPIWWITHDQWVVHRHLNVSPTEWNDLMLLEIFGVWRDIPPSLIANIQPEELLYGLDASMVGCGLLDNGVFPTVLHAAHIKILNRRVCQEIVSYLHGSKIIINEKFICSVGVPWAQLGHGDSGGPLMYYGVVVGISIAVCPKMNDEFHPGKVNIHMNLEKYKGFLNQMAGLNLQ